MNKSAAEQMRELLEQLYNNCTYYQEKGDTKRLINEVGALRGAMLTADIIGIQYQEAKYCKEFIHPLAEKMYKWKRP